ncbi:hypothetical protein BGX33_010985, partial [Mortierella sp. NVP41]
PKRVKSTSIAFSKTAKKVDVKKLKDNIWEMTQQSLKRQAGRDDLDRRWKRKANLEGGDDEDTGETGAGDKDDEQQVITEDQ